MIVSPVPNTVFQQRGGVANFRIAWKGAADGISLDGLFSSDGRFDGVAPGWYRADLMAGGAVIDTMQIGVGDVYVVAGQSNSVSQRQPDSHVMPTIAPGKCILSDYYGHGYFVFRDLGVDPLDNPNGLMNAGCAWQYCAAAMNRPYPVKFVLIGQGNTTGYEWAHEHAHLLFRAWAMFEPKAILWHQGESDCTHPPRDDSFVMLNAIVESLRQVTTTPWLIAENSTSYPPPEGLHEWPVRQAQRDVIGNWEHAHQGPDTDEVRVPGEVEYTGDSLRQHGELWAASLIEQGL